jgi:hypothetical protein
VSIEVVNESGFEDLDEAEFAALGRSVLDAMHVHPQAELRGGGRGLWADARHDRFRVGFSGRVA